MLLSYETLFEVVGTHAAVKALHFELRMCLISPYIIFHLCISQKPCLLKKEKDTLVTFICNVQYLACRRFPG